ncbi:MAG: DMT family transporter [Bryobacteraceae bacterium]
MKLTTPARSGFITGLYVPLIPLLVAIIYRKLPLFSECAGITLAAIGMSLMTLDFARLTVGPGDLLTLGCAVAFAIHMLILGHYATRIDTQWLTLLQLGTCATLAALTVPWIEQPYGRWSTRVVLAVAVTSLLATALAFTVQTWGQRHTTPSRTALIFALEPVFAWLTSYLYAGEVLTRQVVFGAVCILAGILLVELKPGTVPPHQLS